MEKSLKPKNNSKPWTGDLEFELVQLLKQGKSIEECAEHFERTVGAIHSRQLAIARELVDKGNTIVEAAIIVRVSEASIRQSLDASSVSKARLERRREQKQNKINEIFPIVASIKPDTPLSVLKEIRDLIKEAIAKTDLAPQT
jgi:hypothetical protein